MSLFDHVKDFWQDFWSTFFEHVWETIKEIVTVIFKDFWMILLALVGMALLWYLTGGYDRAEKAYLAEQKQKDQQEQILLELERQKQRDPNAGIYIVR